MPRIALPEGVSVHCAVDDFLWPWDRSTPVLMMHGFARNATFWNRWVPAVSESHRVYRPDLLGCGLSQQPPNGYRYTPDKVSAQILAVLEALSLPRVHWVGGSHWTVHLPRRRCALMGLGTGVVGQLAIGSIRSTPVQSCAIRSA